jgi:ABC-type transporter Mla subunit MlaD
MARFFKWTLGLTAAGVGTIAMVRAVQAGRRRLKNAIGEAEAVAGRTRAALEETEAALHQAQKSL